MTKIHRNYSCSKTYHIIFKGIDSQNIFYDDQDRKIFLEKLIMTKKEYNNKIYSYCLMDNHIHMVIKIEKEFLSKAMQTLMIRYVRYFNKKYKRTGTLLQNRFKSKNIENQRYFLEVCKYIHRNPENAGMAKTEDYKWSSYNEYLGKETIIDKKVLLHYLNNDINEFIKYTTKNDSDENINEMAEYEILTRLSDDEVANIIVKIFDITHSNEIPYFFKNLDKDQLKEYIKKIKNIKGTNKTQISRIIRINRCVIERIWNN